MLLLKTLFNRKLEMINRKLEIKKCHNNFEYFLSQYIRFRNDPNNIIDLYDFQEKYIDDMRNYKLMLVPKYRQGGFTSLAVYYKLWQFFFGDKRVIASVFGNLHQADCAFEMCFFNISRIPNWLIKNIVIDRHHRLMCLDNGNIIQFGDFQTSLSNTTDVLIDECPTLNEFRKFQILKSENSDTSVVAICNGGFLKNQLHYNWFYNEMLLCKKNQSPFHLSQFDWRDHPGYTPQKVRCIRATLTKDVWRTEMECEWL